MRRRAHALLLLAVVAAVGLGSGCKTTKRAPCLPAPLVVDRTTVVAGAQVTLSSAGFTSCTDRYPRGKTYDVELATVGRQPPWRLGSVPVAPDGSFRSVVTIPPHTSPGVASLQILGSPFDDCGDTHHSCVGYGTQGFLVVAPQGG